MNDYEKMINICKQIIEFDDKQKEKYSDFYSKRLRRLFNEAKKTATLAKKESMNMDKEYMKK